jgi:hypothetical protein
MDVACGDRLISALQPRILEGGGERLDSPGEGEALTVLLPSLHFPKFSASATKSLVNLSVKCSL